MKYLSSILLVILLPCVVNAQSIGEEAPEFESISIDGVQTKLSDLRGKVVLLDFWASWCGPCREELPFLVELYEAKKDDGFEILAINVDENSEIIEPFLTKLGVDLPFSVLPNPDGSLPELYNIPGMPTAVFVDRSGTIRGIHAGFRESYKEKYQNELTTLLEESE